ncbi:hypothetical protein ACFQ08_11770 [Streptosporangium algeriense]|uniref:Uncharacterized protein n=1 Tax=Streptosporangium algeriense TaxID=1682748 RepID=A0ABW3DQF3_9ACTN
MEYGRRRARGLLKAVITWLVVAAALAGGAVLSALREPGPGSGPVPVWSTTLVMFAWAAVCAASWQAVWYMHFSTGGGHNAEASGAAVFGWGMAGVAVVALAAAMSWWFLLIHLALIVIMIVHESSNVWPEGDPMWNSRGS